jgi:dynein assembly factor 5
LLASSKFKKKQKMSEFAERIDATECAALVAKHQRDLNRLVDADRATRKRGIDRLLQELPWEIKKEKASLKEYFLCHLLPNLLLLYQDSVEKCRELSYKLTFKALDTIPSLLEGNDALMVILKGLCNRINDVPFLEPAEELRLQIIDIIYLMIDKHVTGNGEAFVDILIATLSKSLLDNFPSVKRRGAELVIMLCKLYPKSLQMSFKSILKPLILNSNHQHSKTRSLTITAIGMGICTLRDEYEALMNEQVLAILHRMVADRNNSTRKELANVIVLFMKSRMHSNHSLGRQLLDHTPSSTAHAPDMECVVLLLLLCGDESDEVSEVATTGINKLIEIWCRYYRGVADEVSENTPGFAANAHIEDGEVEVKRAMEIAVDGGSDQVEGTHSKKDFVEKYLRFLLDILITGAQGWTVESKKRYLKGLEVAMGFAQGAVNGYLTSILSCLSSPIRDEEAVIRLQAEQCCAVFGAHIQCADLLDLVLPRIVGDAPDGDSYLQRTSYVRILTNVIKGFVSQQREREVDVNVVNRVCAVVGKVQLYKQREVLIRESILLLVRAVLDNYFDVILEDHNKGSGDRAVMNHVLLAFLFLMGKCPGESDIVPQVAATVAGAFASKLAGNNEQQRVLQPVLGQYFKSLFDVITSSKDLWAFNSPQKCAFEVLIRECPKYSWQHSAEVIKIITDYVQPKKGPAEGSAEAHTQSYAAQRGEEVFPETLGEIDIRLSMLALLEGLIRDGNEDWECAKHVAASAETIIKNIFIINLVWRVGRVEATVRKVALAATYGILKAGAVTPDVMTRTASELVPLLVSNLDDSDVSTRQISCLCISILFERLRGAFGEDSISSMYPILLKRLDDSNDHVRINVCNALEHFCQCAPRNAYTSTCIDYTLDQLFIHLDDVNPAIQDAVYRVIIMYGTHLDKARVLKKAESNIATMRSPFLCQKIQNELQI